MIGIKMSTLFLMERSTRLPVKAEGFEHTSTGTLPRPTLTVSNLDSTMTVLLALVNATTAGNDLGGAEVWRIRTLSTLTTSTSSRKHCYCTRRRHADYAKRRHPQP